MEEIFGRNGLISKHHKDYEYRGGQIKMAEAVLRAFEEKKHLTLEGLNRIISIKASLNSKEISDNLKLTFPNIIPALIPEIKDREIKDLN